MNKIARNYILQNYTKIANLKTTTKSTIELVVENCGKNIFVRKVFNSKISFYKKLVPLNHPNLAKVYMLFLDQATTYVIEEYIKGESLDIVLSQKNYLPEKQVINIALQLCSCLEYLHQNKIAHLDIKPDNIILCENNNVKLIDFDAAKIIGKKENPNTQKLGTTGYAPPEQYGISQINEKSDIYSLGITLKELLGKNYNGYLAQICQKCTHLDPMQRISSAKELKQMIKRPNRKLKNTILILFLLIITYTMFILSKNYIFSTPFYQNNTQTKLNIENLSIKIPLDTYEKQTYSYSDIKITSQKIPLPHTQNSFNIQLQITAITKTKQTSDIKLIVSNTSFIKSNQNNSIKFINTKENQFQAVIQHHFLNQNDLFLSFDYLDTLKNPQLEIIINENSL